MKNNKLKISNFDMTSFLAGALAFTLVTGVFYECGILPQFRNNMNNTEKSTLVDDNSESETAATEASKTVTAYNTQIKQFEIKTSSGETIHCTTPENYYSLTDQYMENLETYYSIDSLKSDNMVVVGDSTVPYSSKTIINANCLSDVQNILDQVHANDESYNSEEILESEAYTYMKTGEIPEDAPDNYAIDEVDSFTQDDITFKVFKVEYDTTYENEAQDTSTNTDNEPVTVHTEQLAAYSDTEDAVEIVLIQEEFNQEEGLKLLREFLNANEE